MVVEMTQDWGGHKKGAQLTLDDGEGCHLISTGVAVPISNDPVPAVDMKTKRQRILHRRKILATMPKEKEE